MSGRGKILSRIRTLFFSRRRRHDDDDTTTMTTADDYDAVDALVAFVTSAAGMVVALASQREWTVFPRNGHDQLTDQLIAWREYDHKWRKHTGVRYALYLKICAILAEDPLLAPRRQTHNLVPLERRVLIVLWMIRSGMSQTQAELMVGCAQQSIGRWFWQIVEGLIRAKRVAGLYLPTEIEEIAEMARGFESFPNSRCPNQVAAVDGTHIGVASDDLSYLGAKGITINIQAMVDSNFMVRDINYERGHCPGAFNDINMYDWSQGRIWVEEVHKLGRKNIGGTTPLGYWVAADGGYHLGQTGLLIPFAKERGSTAPLQAWQNEFNFRLSSSRMVVEQAFGMIKSRSTILQHCKEQRIHPEKVVRLFVACCVIHNLCMLDGDVPPRNGIVHNGSPPSDDLEDVSNDTGPAAAAQAQRVAKGKEERIAVAYHLSQVFSEEYN